jgi:hypothetical protein
MPLLGGVVCSGVCRPGCGVLLLLLLLGASVPGGGGGTADGAHVHVCPGLLNCAGLTVAGMVIVGVGLLWMLSSADLHPHRFCTQRLAGH